MGYGHEYKKAATRVTRGCESYWTSLDDFHHKIHILSQKILLRFTIEACTSSTNGTSDEDTLLTEFSGLGIGRASASSSRDTKKPQATYQPSVVSLSPKQFNANLTRKPLIEFKTCAAYREPDWAGIYLQLYLSQAAFLYIAKHECGNFNTLEKVVLGSESMKIHARCAEHGLAKL
ncbi:hypothetical protein BDR04DRAFT_1212282 [Suillus decipiens]|nr:hypothetical protein BDR04DRAFT_1212282 [Suillus decipiens]